MDKFIRRLIIFLFLSGVVSPVQAQWYKKVFPALTQKGLPASVQRKVLQAGQTQPVSQSVLKLIRNYHPQYGSLDDSPSTAFVIEENLQGTPRLWGVTVEHYHFDRPAVWHPSSPQTTYPITLQAAGQSAYSDVLLFSIPQELRSKVYPLKLAKTLPKPGEELSSYGYYHDGFQQSHSRIVKGITPARLTTSYAFSPSVNKTGACGGPVLNAQNEVVGIHCGSYAPQDNSFAIPVTHIRRLLQAYYQHNQNTEPLLFNGQKIYALKVNQALRQVISLRAGEEVEFITLHSSGTQLDPQHLENVLTDPRVDQLILHIEQSDFTTNKPLPPFKLLYDLKTGQIAPY